MTTTALTLQKTQKAEAFFPVTTKSVLFDDATKPGFKKIFRGKKIIANAQTGDGLSIVSDKHLAVSHREAYHLGRNIFHLLFKCNPDIYKEDLNKSTTDYCVDLVNEQCKIRMTSSGIEYQSPSEDRLEVEQLAQDINMLDVPAVGAPFVKKDFTDEYYPFIRVTNYLRGNQLFVIEVGYYRWKCSNGLMFGRRTDSTFEHSYLCPGLDYIGVMAENHFRQYNRDFLQKAVELWNLLKTPVQKTDMKLLVLQLFEEDLFRLKLVERTSVMNQLNVLVDKYSEEIGENANAMVNVATDLLKLLHRVRISPSYLQAAVGEWMSRIPNIALPTDTERAELLLMEQQLLHEEKRPLIVVLQ
jgi:hypothetical protein